MYDVFKSHLWRIMRTAIKNPYELVSLITRKLNEIEDLVKRVTDSIDEGMCWSDVVEFIGPPDDIEEEDDTVDAPENITWSKLVDRKFLRLFELMADLEGLLVEFDLRRDDLKSWNNPHKITMIKMRKYLLPLIRRLQSIPELFSTDDPEELEDCKRSPFTSLVQRDRDEDESLTEMTWDFLENIRDTRKHTERIKDMMPK